MDTNNLILFISKFILNGIGDQVLDEEQEDERGFHSQFQPQRGQQRGQRGQAQQEQPQPPVQTQTQHHHPHTQACSSSLNNPSTLQLFQAKSIPSISIHNYLVRILRYCPSTNEVFISLIIYFDRMKLLSSLFTINSYNIHRLIIAGITVSSKFFSDIFYTNSRYAKVGGLPLSELNQLELHFLLLNDFNLVINQSELDSYTKKLLETSID
ncbi:hypothetical protein E3P92_00249 [Wallemia ichthyophaga]|nr:hypothetical protein E3P91_00525 [Wallemia ichthyophaga]TIA84067.1 hypothetical protein E3P98_00391 [Wallemia ichthyophaga]TIA93461.1 hypothetical protein E3P97_00941 [Wallemia ichthyophaga]TIA97055.1 hypothetical protein E3P95_02981 [Wallemia ichthyophaga]TIA97703.1 hypothetical protein E3P94_03193 [Wallemia ichthyophaga]